MAKRTPLHDKHVELGARMVEFAGWEMPVQYSGLIEEHRAVRKAAGIFDVSHMGEIEIAGPKAESLAQHLTTNDVYDMADGKAHYSLMLNDRGTVIDDVILYRFNHERYIFVVNASNTEKDFIWMRDHAEGDVAVRNLSDEFALLAFQGPLAHEILQPLTSIDLASINYYHFREGTVCDMTNCIVARTGYTGEDGFEIFCSPDKAPMIWDQLLDRGKTKGVLPVGLGARDTLRMEMKYSLYGNEIGEDTDPFEAGLAWVVKMGQSNDFIGKQALMKIKEKGTQRKLVGFTMLERAIPRSGYKILSDGEEVGVVTSGTLSPSLDQPIGIGFVRRELAAVGTKLSIDIRGRPRQAEVVKTPFYKR